MSGECYFLFNTLKINTLSDTCNFYLRLLGNRHFPEIQRKYGKKVRIYTLHEEEFSIIESLSEDVKVADILKEFDLKTHRQHKEIAEKEQDKFYI